MADPDQQPTPTQRTPKAAGIPAWLWPHVLSLEAPAVAVLWALALGRLHGVPWWPGALPGLALCVWTIYLADRTIDTFGVGPQQLDARHQVYRRFRPLLLGLILPACLAGLVWLGFWVVPAALMWQCLVLGMLVLLYLAIYSASQRPLLNLLLVAGVCLIALIAVNTTGLEMKSKAIVSVVVVGLLSLLMLQRTRRRWSLTVPKEIVGGLLFAMGCTVWVRFIGTGADFIGRALETILLAALFTCNLTGISARERDDHGAPQPTTMQYGHDGMLLGLGMLSAFAIVAAHKHWASERLEPIGWAAAAGGFLLALLHARRRHMSLDAYRVLADIAVAVPALGLLWVASRY